MNVLARATSAATVVLLACGGLVGCSDDGDSTGATDSSGAQTRACRAYALGAGADGEKLAQELDRVVNGNGSYNEQDVTKRLVAVRTGAKESGLTAGLPTKDYRLFRDVVAASLKVDDAVSDTEAGSLDPAAVGSYVLAVKALGAVCD